MRQPIHTILDMFFWFISKIIHRKKPKIIKEHIKKILIVKYCSIGDVLMTTSFVSETRKNFPDAQIDYYVGGWSEPVIRGNKDIDNVYININNKTSQKRFRDKFRREKYDIVFILDPGIKDLYFGYSLNPKILVGQDAYYRGFLLNYKVLHAINDGKHERDIYLEMLHVMGLKTSDKNMHLYLSAKEISYAEGFLKKNISRKTKIIGISSGGGSNPWGKNDLKHWIYEYYAELCDNLIAKGFCIIFFGSESDSDTVRKIIGLMKISKSESMSQIIDLAGKLDIRKTAAIIRFCDVFVTNDSSLMHVAAAVGTKTVSIFGPTNPKLLKPYGKDHIALYTHKNCVPDYAIKDKNFNCHPCYTQIIGKFKYDCKTRQCMYNITVADVEDSIASLL